MVQSKHFKLNANKCYLNRITTFHMNKVNIIKADFLYLKVLCHSKQSFNICKSNLIVAIHY